MEVLYRLFNKRAVLTSGYYYTAFAVKFVKTRHVFLCGPSSAHVIHAENPQARTRITPEGLLHDLSQGGRFKRGECRLVFDVTNQFVNSS